MSPKQGVPKPLPPAKARNLNPNQFVTVYRGLRHESPEHLNTSYLGSHWTSDVGVARTFAANPGGSFINPKPIREGVVIKGRVHPDSIVKPHTSEWYRMGGIRPGSEEEENYMAGNEIGNHVILPPDSTEKEVTVRRGSKVKIAGMTHMTKLDQPSFDWNKRTFRANKRGKA